MNKSFTNKLINESSPYLLQHAHNPVNWFPWSEEALEKAREEDKPILVSIGYAACHWCHVMERESFENEATARIMNEHFINIKIDREERPDLDHIYMDAVQAMTGSGGWPLNVFLTPDRKPFYGGTYFPPARAYNRPSWQETLYGVIQAFRERRHEINAQAENLIGHIMQSNSFGLGPAPGNEFFTNEKPRLIFENIMKSADKVWGGFGQAPKFPQTYTIRYLLHYNYYTGEKEALQQALLSLDKMIDGGIYDQLGGGFARYSTDGEWLAPHFEKMLYDNALLVSVLAEAYQATQADRYKEVIAQTLEFVQRELMHEKKGFYAALDADSEGVEGKYYVWTRAEADQLLGADSNLFCEYYDISATGNWEHTNILWVKKPLSNFAADKGLKEEELENLLRRCRKIMLEARGKRERPLLDDKIILGWNALMNIAFSKAYAATGRDEYRKLALENMDFLLSAFAGSNSNFYHTWKNGEAKFPAFLDDYAFLVQALLHLHEITGERGWLGRAREVTAAVIVNFGEDESGYFYYTPVWQEDVIVRKKEVYDGATPSGNAVMAENLLWLSTLYDIPAWKERAEKMLASLGTAITKYPTSFGCWACLGQQMIQGTNEITVMGEGFRSALPGLLAIWMPHKVMMASGNEEEGFPLLSGKKVLQKTTIYLCRNNTCQAPVFSTKELISLINRGQKQQ